MQGATLVATLVILGDAATILVAGVSWEKAAAPDERDLAWAHILHQGHLLDLLLYQLPGQLYGSWEHYSSVAYWW
uniref:Uncharacterized protein n=1 Tax=Romanomermis culicivorax TaxID=13658 RepID=A0A915IYF4_ROMCU